MASTIGVLAVHQITTAFVSDGQLVRSFRSHPDVTADVLADMPVDEILTRIANEMQRAADGQAIESVGVAVPGIVRHGTIEDSPNLPQLKGTPLCSHLTDALCDLGRSCPVFLFNDADAAAAGIAAQTQELNRLIRVWSWAAESDSDAIPP